MKKLYTPIIIVIILLAFAYVCGLATGLNYDPSVTYESPVVVTEVNEELGWVTLVDWNGEAWCIRGDGYEVDELLIATFNNNNTETIYDDMIVMIERGQANIGN